MLNNITDKKLGVVGTASAVVASLFLSPEHVMIPAACSILAIAGSIVFVQSRWISSKADEWLLVIRDGKLVKSGVGLKTFVGLTDTVVKFPSKIQQVTFRANNVTQEMQGVEITGFAFWSVYREQDGPFRCYKYMEGNDANSNVQALCESVLRSLIANSSLQNVLRNRNHLRDSIKEELKDQFKGWGVWLQTVEITEVKISSDRLFTDLQAQFRQTTRLKAEQIELGSSQKISEVQQNTSMKISELSEDVKTQKQVIANTEGIKRKELEQNFEAKKNELEIKRMERQKKLELEKYKNEFSVSEQTLIYQQQIQLLTQTFKNQQQIKNFDLYKLHTPLTLEKYEIDSMQRVLVGQGIRNISISQFSGSSKQSIGAIMPVLGFGAAQLRTGSL